MFSKQPLFIGANASLRSKVEATYGDVHHYALMGVPILEGRMVPGTLHVFVKVLQTNDVLCKLRGFLFFETAAPPGRRGSKYLAPRGIYRSLVLQAQTHEESKATNLTILEPPPDKKGRKEGTPHEFFFTCENCTSNMVLSVQQFKRVIPLGNLLQRAAPREGSTSLQIVKFLPTRAGNFPMELYMELLKASVMHHAKLGFTRCVLYARPWDAILFQHQPSFRQLRDLGLKVIEWEALASPSDVEIGNFDFIIQMFHVSLSFWGVKSRVLLTDLDEFFALPRGRTIHDELQKGGCMWRWVGARLAVHDVTSKKLELPTATSHILFNWTLWQMQKKVHRLSGIGAPLWALTLRNRKARMEKVFLQPSSQMMGFIHRAYCCPKVKHAASSSSTGLTSPDPGHMMNNVKSTGGKHVRSQIQELPCRSKLTLCTTLQQSCAFVAHVPDMYKVRLSAKQSQQWEEDSSWLWSAQ